MPHKVRKRRRRKAPEDAPGPRSPEGPVEVPYGPAGGEDRPEAGGEWEAEPEETRPEVMEPVVEVVEGGEGEATGPVRGAALYRERRLVEEAIEAPVARGRTTRPTRAERRAMRDAMRIEREVERERRRQENPSWLRGTLAYKTFYDMVCNRVGVIVIGFGVAMILFTISYDWLQGESLSLGRKHWLALVVSLAVYFFGMALEGLRVLSGECEGLEAQARAQARTARDGTATATGPEDPGYDRPLPMVPDDVVDRLINGNGATDRDAGDGSGRGTG